MKDNSKRNGGIGFCGLLGIVFIVLKLIGVISWNWLCVLSPIWIPVIVMIVFLAIHIVLCWIASKL